MTLQQTWLSLNQWSRCWVTRGPTFLNIALQVSGHSSYWWPSCCFMMFKPIILGVTKLIWIPTLCHLICLILCIKSKLCMVHMSTVNACYIAGKCFCTLILPYVTLHVSDEHGLMMDNLTDDNINYSVTIKSVWSSWWWSTNCSSSSSSQPFQYLLTFRNQQSFLALFNRFILTGQRFYRKVDPHRSKYGFFNVLSMNDNIFYPLLDFYFLKPLLMR